MLPLPLWHTAETKVFAGLSWVMWPAELIEMAQYSPFNMAGVFIVFFLVWLAVYLSGRLVVYKAYA